MLPSHGTNSPAFNSSSTRNWVPIACVAGPLPLPGGGFAPAGRAQDGGDRDHHHRPHKADLSKVVFVGDSLTAGFQSDSLIDTAQPHGWANVVAGQAGTPLSLPLIAPPGIPNVLELVSPGPRPIIITAPGTSTGRDNPFLQATDLGVPGALLNDALVTKPSFPIDDLTDLILGLPGLSGNVPLTQGGGARAVQPTPLFVGIWNSEILGAAAAAGPSLATPIGSFQT